MDDKALAEDLVDEAWESDDLAKRFELSSRAAALDPGLIDAYVAMATTRDDPAFQIPLLSQAIEHGWRLWQKTISAQPREFSWYHVSCRPFIRALHNMALALRSSDRLHESAEIAQRLLEINPSDNTGVRDILMMNLLDLERYKEAKKLSRNLAKTAPGGDMPSIMYSRALLAFREEGASADDLLKLAVSRNRCVPSMIGTDYRPGPSLRASAGSAEEVAEYLRDGFRHWNRVPGAIEWLRGAHDRWNALAEKEKTAEIDKLELSRLRRIESAAKAVIGGRMGWKLGSFAVTTVSGDEIQHDFRGEAFVAAEGELIAALSRLENAVGT